MRWVQPCMYKLMYVRIVYYIHANNGVCQPAGRCTIICISSTHVHDACMHTHAIYCIYIYCKKNARSLVTHCAQQHLYTCMHACHVQQQPTINKPSTRTVLYFQFSLLISGRIIIKLFSVQRYKKTRTSSTIKIFSIWGRAGLTQKYFKFRHQWTARYISSTSFVSKWQIILNLCMRSFMIYLI